MFGGFARRGGSNSKRDRLNDGDFIGARASSPTHDAGAATVNAGTSGPSLEPPTRGDGGGSGSSNSLPQEGSSARSASWAPSRRPSMMKSLVGMVTHCWVV